MDVVFVLLFALSLLLLVVSMIKPGHGKDGKQFKRRDLAIGFGFFAILFLILTGVTAPKHNKRLQISNAANHSQNSSTPDNTTVQSQSRVSTAPDASSTPSTPTPAPTPPSVDTSRVKSYLSDGTNYYVNLFQQAKDALGSTQYPDAYTGLAALDDPTSAASTWSKFNQKFTGADYSSAATQAYNNASNVYTDANVDTPSAINDWNDDINQAYSDIGPWVEDATSWQISSIPTSKLDGDAQKFQQDIAAAKADIGKL